MPPVNPPKFNLNLAPSPLQVNAPLPANPALRAILDDAVARAKYAVLVAAAESGHTAPGALDAAARHYVSTRAPGQRQRAAQRARAVLESGVTLRRRDLGRYAGVPTQDYLTLGSHGVAGRVSALKVSSPQLQHALQALHINGGVEPPKGIVLKPPAPKPGIKLNLDADLIEGMKFTKLRLFVQKVRCLEESDEVGSDEISMGTVVTDPSGNTFVGHRWNVSSDFDEGELVTFPGLGHKATGWNIVNDGVWPKVYSCVLAMGERDDGGFAEFLKILWDYVKAEAIALIATGIGAAIGGALGNALGAAIGAAVGAFVGWIISLFADNADEILGAPVLTMTLGSARKSYYEKTGLATGLPFTLHYTGDDSHYRVAIRYQVFTQ